MNAKKFISLSLTALLILLSLISCDDKDNDLLTPAQAVSDLSFTDTDPETGKIAGTLTWTLPDPETNINEYVVYLGDNNADKSAELGKVTKGTTSFDVPAGTDYKAFLLVVAKNADGESTNIASLAVNDVQVTSLGFYILNRGNWNENNASLAYYNFTTGVLTPNLYRNANNEGLGDGAEQLLVYGSKVYVTVTTSSRLVVLEQDGKLIKPFDIRDGNVPLQPRCMAAHNGKVYVSYYAGHSVAVLDTATLTIEKEVGVGRYPEQLAITGGKLYVANSGGLDGSTETGYGKTVSVIDLQSFTVEKEIEVVLNPVQLAADSQGDIYLLSNGNYASVGSALQRIDGATGTVTTIGNGSKMTLVNDKLYVIYAQYNDPTITYRQYDVLKEEVEKESFITDGTTITSPNAIAVDPVSGKIYITDFIYGSTGSLYLFTADGRLEKKEDTGGYDAIWMTCLLQ
ncbi:MAG: hypothetical protein LBQ39_06280 [Tannerellaceae bacterium]|jgi:YVTN family beta-propeller protein|nr:hypothetical protein [Tannerellaceae bacterium]